MCQSMLISAAFACPFAASCGSHPCNYVELDISGQECERERFTTSIQPAMAYEDESIVVSRPLYNVQASVQCNV